MCGPAGSGKSTVARRLEAAGMVRLSFDQEARARGLRTMPLAEEDHADIERALRHQLLEHLDEGHDVVLDFSFWSRDMRDHWRRLLAPSRVTPETLYLPVDRQTCLERVAARSSDDGDDFALAPETAARYYDHFEPPTDEEGPLTVLR